MAANEGENVLREGRRWEDKGEHKWALGQLLSGGFLGGKNGGQSELTEVQEQDLLGGRTAMCDMQKGWFI